jgi:hypothetical protein
LSERIAALAGATRLSALTNRHRMSLEALAKKVSEDAKKTISVMSKSDISHLAL